MLKTCKYCGVVPIDHVCPHKPKRQRYTKDPKLDRFRGSRAWQRKREEIKSRDFYLCRACLANIPPTFNYYNGEELEVHHIIKMTLDYSQRLENDNLITLCVTHHKLADAGKIDAQTLRNLIENDSPPSPR